MYISDKPVIQTRQKGVTIHFKDVTLYLLRSAEDSRKYNVNISQFNYEKNRHELIQFSEQEKKELRKLNLADSGLALDALIDKMTRYLTIKDDDLSTLRGCIQRAVSPNDTKHKGTPFYPSETENSRKADREFYRDWLKSTTRK